MKKEITINGSEIRPITVGEVAHIAENDGSTRRTSVVVRVMTISDTEVRFETKNSIYTLHKPPKNPIAAMMLKKMIEARELQ